ncbi:MAG: nuclear transport factor 2 family protein [Thermoplasmata archaeon]|nr:nuclear transport factor 2 family protein [Thermoplasmata archaeon]
MGEALDVVQRFQAAMARDDWTEARACLDDHLSFSGPFEKLRAPEPYLTSLKRLHGIVERVDMHHVFENGDDVSLWYDLVTNTPTGTARIAEHHHVESGRIRSIEVLFDPRPFAPMFAKGA